jgi:hypothetical protein
MDTSSSGLSLEDLNMLGISPDSIDTYTPVYLPIDQCTVELCGLEDSFFAYRPTKSTNLAFILLFGFSAIVFLLQGIAVKKKWVGFTIVMVTGCVLEVVGYTGRVLAYSDLYSEVSSSPRAYVIVVTANTCQPPFFMQIICLTIAPAFLAAGIYLCLSQIVNVFGPEASRISPRFYPIIFVTCDFLSLVLQGAGGAIATVKTHQGQDPKLGNDIMIAGLSFQVLTMLAFILLALDFAVRTACRIRRLGSENVLNPHYAELRKSWIFRGFLVALLLSTLCIFTRCIYRVAELSHGWSGELMKKENYFVGLESAIIVVAVFMLNVFHPGFCFNNPTQPRPRTDGTVSMRWWYELKRPETSGESSVESSGPRR